MTYPAKYPPAVNGPNWNAMVNRIDGFLPSGTFRSPYSYLIDYDGTDYSASNAFQLVYGGTSDAGGIDGADPHAVIQAAVTNASNGIIKLKTSCGTINMGSDSIVAPANSDLKIIGENMNKIIFQYAGVGSLFSLTTASYSVHLSGFQCEFTGALGTAKAVDLTDARYSMLQDLYIWGVWKRGLELASALKTTAVNVMCSTKETDIPLEITGTSYNNHFFNCHFNGISVGAIFTGSNVSLNGLHGCEVACDAGVAAYFTDSCCYNSLYGCDIETDNGTTVQLDAGTVGNQILGGTATRGAGGSDIQNNGTKTITRDIICGNVAAAVLLCENSDVETGTGAEQTIPHGLHSTPNRVYLCNIDDGANPYQSSVADSTNIYITGVAGKDYVWKAEVV